MAQSLELEQPSTASNSHQQFINGLTRRFLERYASEQDPQKKEKLGNRLAAIILAKERRANMDGFLRKFLNKTAFPRDLQAGLELIRQYGLKGALLYIDIDEFKRFNDVLGHPSGDEIIKILGQAIIKSTRSSDPGGRLGPPEVENTGAKHLLGRVGGDEFAVFLVGANQQGAELVADRIKSRIIELVKTKFPDLSWDQTISIGIALVTQEDTLSSLIEKADRALYQAKQGRNRFVVWEEPSATAG